MASNDFPPGNFYGGLGAKNGDPSASKPKKSSHDELLEVAHMANFRLYKKGETLFREGDRGSEAYVIKKGLVEVSGFDGYSKKVIGTVKAGSIVGEMAVISDMPRMATATAMEETLCVALSRQAVRIMVARTDFETRTLIEFLISQVQDHANGDTINNAVLERDLRILEILLSTPEQLEKLNKMEPFFVLLCHSLLNRAKVVLDERSK